MREEHGADSSGAECPLDSFWEALLVVIIVGFAAIPLQEWARL